MDLIVAAGAFFTVYSLVNIEEEIEETVVNYAATDKNWPRISETLYTNDSRGIWAINGAGRTLKILAGQTLSGCNYAF